MQKKVDKSIFEKSYYSEVLKRYSITRNNIITASIVATGRISDVKKSEELVDIVHDQERAFGHYSPNRYAWISENIKPVNPICNIKRGLGIWNCVDESEEGL